MQEPNDWEGYLEKVENIIYIKLEYSNSTLFAETKNAGGEYNRLVALGAKVKKAISAFSDTAFKSIQSKRDELDMTFTVSMIVSDNFSYAVKPLMMKGIMTEFKKDMELGRIKLSTWIKSNKFLMKVGETPDGKVKTA